MELSGTKKKILDISLDLFSKYGYAQVSMEQIADAVGIKAPSVYKHYKGKQDIFDSIFALMDERYRQQTEKMQMHIDEGEKDLDIFGNITEEFLYEKVFELVQFSLHDEYNCKFRKLLTTHQFSDSKIADIYTERYVDNLLNYHKKLFEDLIKKGVLISGDIDSMAMQYVTPVYTLIGICDRNPDNESECMEKLKRHIHQFNEVYRVDRRQK